MVDGKKDVAFETVPRFRIVMTVPAGMTKLVWSVAVLPDLRHVESVSS